MLLFNVAVVVPFVINSELAKKHATAEDPWAMTWLQHQRGRWRRLQGRELEAGHRDGVHPFRRLEERAAAQDQAHHRARHPVRRDAARHAREGRRGSLDRLSAARISTSSSRRARSRSSACRSPTRCGTSRSTRRSRHSTTSSCARRVAWAMPYEQIQSERLLRPRRADVWRPGERREGGVAAALPLCHRSRQGQGADDGGGIWLRFRDDIIARRRHRDGRRADGRC